MPTFDGGDDFVWVCGPCEGLWHLVCLNDEAVDGGMTASDWTMQRLTDLLDAPVDRR